MKKGQMVDLYYDPLTQQQHAGKAKLIQPEIIHENDPFEYWTVEFVNDKIGEKNTIHEQESWWIFNSTEEDRLHMIRCMTCECHKKSPNCCDKCRGSKD